MQKAHQSSGCRKSRSREHEGGKDFLLNQRIKKYYCKHCSGLGTCEQRRISRGCKDYQQMAEGLARARQRLVCCRRELVCCRSELAEICELYSHKYASSALQQLCSDQCFHYGLARLVRTCRRELAEICEFSPAATRAGKG